MWTGPFCVLLLTMCRNDALPKIRAHLDTIAGSSGDNSASQSGFYTNDFFGARANAFKTGQLHAKFMKPFVQSWTGTSEVAVHDFY